MGEYIRDLLLVSAITVLASLLLPQKPERTRRLIELALSLLVLTVLCRPLSDGLRGGGILAPITLPSYQYGEGLFTQETLSEMEGAVEEGVEQDLASHYGVPASCVEASVTLALLEKELTVSSLTLTLSGEGLLLDHVAVQQYAAKTYQTYCEVKPYGG